MKRIIMLFLLSVVSIFAEVKTELSSYKVITGADGKVEKVSAEQGSPGDVLEYVFYIKNEDPAAIYNLNPIIPIPEGTTVIQSSISPQKNYKVSVNGRDFLDYPIKKDNVAVPMGDYKAVSWEIPQLNEGMEANLKLQVKINSPN